MKNSVKLLLASVASGAFLVACGGGGGGSSPTPVAATPPPPPPTSSSPSVPDFVANDYPASSTLRSICQTVRTDTDLNGNPRGDVQGELLHELFWLRSFMNETYLFFDQVTDSDPNNFTNISAYFDDRLTTATTASGRLVDRFSFIQPTETFEASRSGAPTFGYGARYATLQTNTLPRDWRIAFTQEGSNAETSGFTRGAQILTIDGADFLNGTSQADINAFNAGLFPTAVGEEHIFGVRFPDGTEAEIPVVSQSITIEPVNSVDILENGDESVGYIHYESFGPFTGQDQLFEAFTELSDAGVDDLVLDFRYNGGGLLAIASQIGYMTAGEATEGQIFETIEFNSRSPNVNPFTGQPVTPTPFFDETLLFSTAQSIDPGIDLPTLDLPRVFVLTTEQSCSASEAVMNGLMGIGIEVIQIGTRTCGKPTGQFPIENCGTTYVPLHFRGVNAQGFGDYDDGFAPGQATGATGPVIAGCEVEDDFSALLGSPEEAMLSTALTYASTGSCPSTAVASRDANGPQSSKNAGTLSDPFMNDPRVKAYFGNKTRLDISSGLNITEGTNE